MSTVKRIRWLIQWQLHNPNRLIEAELNKMKLGNKRELIVNK